MSSLFLAIGTSPSATILAGRGVTLVNFPVYELQRAKTISSFSYPLGPRST